MYETFVLYVEYPVEVNPFILVIAPFWATLMDVPLTTSEAPLAEHPASTSAPATTTAPRATNLLIFNFPPVQDARAGRFLAFCRTPNRKTLCMLASLTKL
jgi:hypothetical protein